MSTAQREPFHGVRIGEGIWGIGTFRVSSRSSERRISRQRFTPFSSGSSCPCRLGRPEQCGPAEPSARVRIRAATGDDLKKTVASEPDERHLADAQAFADQAHHERRFGDAFAALSSAYRRVQSPDPQCQQRAEAQPPSKHAIEPIRHFRPGGTFSITFRLTRKPTVVELRYELRT